MLIEIDNGKFVFPHSHVPSFLGMKELVSESIFNPRFIPFGLIFVMIAGHDIFPIGLTIFVTRGAFFVHGMFVITHIVREFLASYKNVHRTQRGQKTTIKV